eukprot:m.185907 g.185907  ORF g.185907 m.185907 type:complete len:328 (-) comp14742_c3_seq1:44-1027(-)
MAKKGGKASADAPQKQGSGFLAKAMWRALFVAVIAVALYSLAYVVPRVEYKVNHTGCVLVTGASSGIGYAAAVELATMGYHVYATVRKERDQVLLHNLKIKTLHPVIMDVTNHQQVADVAAQIAKSGFPFVGLVNNAGISTRAPVELTKDKDVRNVFEVNVFGLLDVTREFLPLLRKAQGRIVNIGSVAGLAGQSYSSTYSGTKFALEGITDSLRREMGPFGVSVSIVEPAYVATAIADKSRAADTQATKEQRAIYSNFFSSVDKKRAEAFQKASPVTVCTDAIVHALTARYPEPRYVVANVRGVPANVIAWVLHLLPDRWEDALMK